MREPCRLGAAAFLVLALGACAEPDDGEATDDTEATPPVTGSPRVLVFSKTAAYRHASIPDAIAALEDLAVDRGWGLFATEDAGVFDDARLSDYDVAVFLLTTGAILDSAQREAFERFVRSGKGWVGVHSASDTEYDWPWYGELVGAYFQAHPAIQEAVLRVERRAHLATQALAGIWPRTDEWYAFQTNPRDSVHVLLSVDEASYDPQGTAMGDHPVAWYHAHDGGRAFYTALGHTSESYREARFLSHLAGGIEWAAGRESEAVILVEFDGVVPNGVWDAHRPEGFVFDVTPEALVMRDQDGSNQHIVRRGVGIDAARSYAVEGLFTILPAEPAPAPNSFCFNLNVAGPEGELGPPSTWSMNVDLAPEGGGVMKYMGFLDGAFQQIGERAVAWGVPGTEYLLRVLVNASLGGGDEYYPQRVSVQVFERGVIIDNIQVDYSSFPYQPLSGEIVRLGANTHGTDWSLRSLRAYYLD